jgi:hypothetical protein
MYTLHSFKRLQYRHLSTKNTEKRTLLLNTKQAILMFIFLFKGEFFV